MSDLQQSVIYCNLSLASAPNLWRCNTKSTFSVPILVASSFRHMLPSPKFNIDTLLPCYRCQEFLVPSCSCTQAPTRLTPSFSKRQVFLIHTAGVFTLELFFFFFLKLSFHLSKPPVSEKKDVFLNLACLMWTYSYFSSVLPSSNFACLASHFFFFCFLYLNHFLNCIHFLSLFVSKLCIFSHHLASPCSSIRSL